MQRQHKREENFVPRNLLKNTGIMGKTLGIFSPKNGNPVYALWVPGHQGDEYE